MDTTDSTARYGTDLTDPSFGHAYETVVRYVGRDRSVLELGCSTGFLARRFGLNGCDVVGVEIDEEAAGKAMQYCDEVIVGDLDALDLVSALDNRRFDVVVAADVLGHLKNPAAVLRQVRRCLTPDGFAIVCLPNVAHASVRLALLSGVFPNTGTGPLDGSHLQFFTRESLNALFDECGYSIAHLQRNDVAIDP